MGKERSSMFWWAFMARCAVAAVCFVSAAGLIYGGVEEGWGWLIFAGILAVPSVSNE